MRVLIISDTHRKHDILQTVLKAVKPLDLLIHLGDLEGGEEYIEALAECPVEMVSGNNDYFTHLDKEKEFMLGKYKVWITHGHNYYVSLGLETIRTEGIAKGMDIVMFGHTHRPVLEQGAKVTLLNPGSISYPRQDGRCPSYMMLDLDEKGEAHYTIRYIDRECK